MAKLALCASVPIGNGDAPPEWLHLLPAGEIVSKDGRGPYRVPDPRSLVTVSMAGGKLVLDENHATDLAAPRGLPAPARGWIVELQARSDGFWGRVEWTQEAKQAAIWRTYRGVSPVILHREDGTVLSIARASLTNTPNLTGLVALHHTEKNMDLRSQLVTMLDLPQSAGDQAILTKVADMVKLATGKDVATPVHQQAQHLSLQAVGYRDKLARLGVHISLPAAVHAVRSGKTS